MHQSMVRLTAFSGEWSSGRAAAQLAPEGVASLCHILFPQVFQCLEACEIDTALLTLESYKRFIALLS